MGHLADADFTFKTLFSKTWHMYLDFQILITGESRHQGRIQDFSKGGGCLQIFLIVILFKLQFFMGGGIRLLGRIFTLGVQVILV